MREDEMGSSPSSSRSSISTAKPCASPAASQEIRRAAALVAEMEIGADDDAGDAQRLDQEAGDEVLGLDLREVAVERHHDDAVEPERLGEPRLGVGGVRRNMNGAGAKTSRGCGSKVSTIAGTPRAAARAFSAVEDVLVAAMEAVEIADGDHGAVERGGHVSRPASR